MLGIVGVEGLGFRLEGCKVKGPPFGAHLGFMMLGKFGGPRFAAHSRLRVATSEFRV